MQIYVNGKLTSLSDTNTTLLVLIELLDLARERLAIELNEVVIPRRDWETVELKSDDKVEIVHFVGGG